MINLFEHVLSMGERTGLPSQYFGLPSDKRFPIDTVENLKRAVAFFKLCPDNKKTILANNINKRLGELNLTLNLDDDSPFAKYYVPPVIKESTATNASAIDVRDSIFKQLNIDARNEDIVVTINEIRISALSKIDSDDCDVIEGAIREYLKGIFLMAKYNTYDIAQLKLEAISKAYTVVYSTAKRIIDSYTNRTETTAVKDLKELLFTILTSMDVGFMKLIMRLLQLAPGYYNFRYSEEDKSEIDGMMKYATKVSDAQMSMFDYNARSFDVYLNKIKYPLYHLEQEIMSKEATYERPSQKYIIPRYELRKNGNMWDLVYMDEGRVLDLAGKEVSFIINEIANRYDELTTYLASNNLTMDIQQSYVDIMPPYLYSVSGLADGVTRRETNMYVLECDDNSIAFLAISTYNKKEMFKLTFKCADRSRELDIISTPLVVEKLDLDVTISKTLEGLNIEPDGTIRFTIRPAKTYMDEYMGCHRLIKTNFENKNYTAVKDNLCFLFTLVATIEREVMFIDKNKKPDIKSDKYKDAIDARALAVNEFKVYMAKLQKVEKEFDFVKYYEDSNYGKIVYKVTPDAIKGIRKLLSLIIAG